MNLEKYLGTDLGINSVVMYNTISNKKNSTFIDLGVRTGISSEIMLINSDIKKNKVVGIDVDFSKLNFEVSSHKNYTKILGDSVTIGKNWNKKIDVLFIDTFHIKEQVLSELYFWYPHLNDDGIIIFHDTNWPEGKFDVYGDIVWDRVENGIKDFFKIDQLNFEDDNIKMSNYPDSWGMTIVELKNKKDYISEYQNWVEVFKKRNSLISLFWDENNKNEIEIELSINV